jgi:hypothetical protein
MNYSKYQKMVYGYWKNYEYTVIATLIASSSCFK